jgi:hypothetical protein
VLPMLDIDDAHFPCSAHKESSNKTMEQIFKF